VALVERTGTPIPTRAPKSRRRARATSLARRSISLGEGERSKPEPPPTADGATPGRAAVQPGVGFDDTEDRGGAKLLLTDARVAFLLLNHARYRMIERLFGVSKDQANAATLIAGLVVAEALHEKGKRMLAGPALPSAGDTALGTSALRVVVHGIAGPSSQDIPLVGTLIAIAALGRVARPAVGRTLHGVRVSSQRIHVAFGHRYGHLIGDGRRPLYRARPLADDSAAPRTA
jgi:hypothetical protein